MLRMLLLNTSKNLVKIGNIVGENVTCTCFLYSGAVGTTSGPKKNKTEYSRIEKKVFIVTELCKRRLRELCKAQFMYFICLFLTRKQQKSCETLCLYQQDIEDLDHYEMKEEEPVDGKKSEDDGIEKENLAILEKIRKNQRQDHLNVSLMSGSAFILVC